ncbi:MAG: D-alanine--D-alanine ligase [Lachnospiraceae bacterium]
MKVVVLAGGTSTERDVSLSSGSMIYEALKKRGHDAVLLDVYLGYEGEWEKVFDERKDCTIKREKIGTVNPDIHTIKALRKDGGRSFFGPGVIAICQEADLVFLALHGENGENGKLQAAFDLLGISYTGTDSVSSALCMDKGITKELFTLHHIPTPRGRKLKKKEADSREISLPCVVKACCGGSSVGVFIVHTEEEYEQAKEEAFRYDNEIIIEAYIKGREFSVGVLEGKALPVIEIAPIEGFYDYRNKYQAGSTIETCPALLSQEETNRIQGIAQRVFQVLRLKGYARMDFMMDEMGQMYCLEANTLPGMTPTSLLPQEAAVMGMSFEDLCEKIMEIALKKEMI